MHAQHRVSLQVQVDEVPRLELATSTLDSAKFALSDDAEGHQGLEPGSCAVLLMLKWYTDSSSEIA
jgi:hypothetical protein